MSGRLKRYLVFAGPTYYPSGGWGDFVSSYDTVELASAAARKQPLEDWWHIVDTETGQEVEPT